MGMLQIEHGLSRETETDIFAQTTELYKFTRNQDFRIPSVNKLYHCSVNTSYLGLENMENRSHD